MLNFNVLYSCLDKRLSSYLGFFYISLNKSSDKIFSTFILMTLSIVCHAECADILEFRDEGDVACRIMPYNKNKEIHAYVSKNENSNYNLIIEVVNIGNGKILSRIVEKEPSFLGVSLRKLKIDTAPYIVAKNKRASVASMQ